MGWNYLSVPKLQPCGWSLGMDKLFHTILYWANVYLFMSGLKFFHVSNRALCMLELHLFTTNQSNVSPIALWNICERISHSFTMPHRSRCTSRIYMANKISPTTNFARWKSCITISFCESQIYIIDTYVWNDTAKIMTATFCCSD